MDAVVLFALNYCMCSLQIRNNTIAVTLPAFFLTDIMLHVILVCSWAYMLHFTHCFILAWAL